VGGARESLPPGLDTRCLVPPRASAPLARAICALLADPLLRESLGHQGRRHVLAAHDVRHATAAVTEVYRELLAPKYGEHAARGEHTECRESSHT
jgi:glycosyltransferase involved in cell wall biosynthesis